MADQDTEQLLSRLRQSLEKWGRSVPAEAAGFHERRSALHERVMTEQGRWSPFGRNDAALVLARDTHSLGSVADGLIAVFDRLKGVRASVEQARGIVTRLSDDGLSQWFDQWRARWQYHLQGVGRSAELEQHVRADMHTLQATEWEVTEVRTSVQAFAEATDLLTRFGGHIQAAEPRAVFTSLRQALLRTLPTVGLPNVAWRDSVTRAVEPLKAIANQPTPQAPQDLAAAYRRATEAESWAEAIGVDAAPAQELLRSIDDAQRDPAQWVDAAVLSLVTRANDLATSLREEAHRRRADAEGALRADLEAAQEACGSLSDVADEIQRVERLSREEPYHHDQWKKAFPAARRTLLQEIGARRRDVVSWVRARRGDLIGRLKDLAPRPLPASESQMRSVLQGEIESAESLPEAAEHILERLHAMLRWIAATGRIEEAARNTFATIAQRARALAVRHAELSGHEQALDLQPPDLDRALEELCAPAGPTEPLFESIAKLQEQLERRSSAVVQRCREKVTEDVEVCRRATAIVQTVLPGVTAAPPPVWAADITAADAVRARESVQRARENALALVAQATDRLLARLPEVRAGIEEAMSRPDTTDESRISAEEILDVLAAEAWKSAGPIEGLDKLKRSLSRADILLSELSARENEIARLRGELDRMFLNASEEGLGKYLPDTLAQRARSLRRGLPDKPRYLGAAIHQLEQAHALFGRAVGHARRAAVARFLPALALVESEAARDAAFAARAEPVLVEARSLRRDQLPPADVRDRVIQLAASVRRGGHRG